MLGLEREVSRVGWDIFEKKKKKKKKNTPQD